MIQSVNFPLSDACAAPYGGWAGVCRAVKDMGLQGVEGIWALEDVPEDFPRELLTGYHLTFYHDWLDFWRGDRTALVERFGSMEMVRRVYGGTEPEDLLEFFRADLHRALELKAEYLVFHVSDVSLEEGYTYRWRHTCREVSLAAAEIARLLLRDVPKDVDFLLENQWWPGFTFTDPAETEALFAAVDDPRAGILLDTGHLMNTQPRLRTQKEGVEYILDCIRRHGSLSERIRGMHFHQSLSGQYVRHAAGAVPVGFPEDYFDAFAVSYGHIERIDRHRPWTDPDCVRILDCTQPRYLTHELKTTAQGNQMQMTRRQLRTISRGRRGSDFS